MSPSKDGNLLFGLLALQTGMIDRPALVAAFHAWTRDKSRCMSERLVAQGAIDGGDLEFLEGLLAGHLKRHGGDVENRLAAVPAAPALATDLAAVGDPEIDATLLLITAPDSSPTSVDTSATVSFGEVFVALDAELNREVALKHILDHHADVPSRRTRFALEAEIKGRPRASGDRPGLWVRRLRRQTPLLRDAVCPGRRPVRT